MGFTRETIRETECSFLQETVNAPRRPAESRWVRVHANFSEPGSMCTQLKIRSVWKMNPDSLTLDSVCTGTKTNTTESWRHASLHMLHVFSLWLTTATTLIAAGGGGERRRFIARHFSPRQTRYFAATQKDQTHKYCLFWHWWKTNSQLKSSLPRLVPSPSTTSLSPSSCSVCHSALAAALFPELGWNSTYTVCVLMTSGQEALSATVFPLCRATQFLSRPLLWAFCKETPRWHALSNHFLFISFWFYNCRG